MTGHVRRRNGRWQARYRGPDRRERSRTFDRKLDAERWLTARRAELARGTWIDPAGAQLTFGDWWATYMDQSAKRASTKARDHGAAERWLLPHLGGLRLGQITPTNVRSVVTAMSDAGLAQSTVRTFYGVLQGAMTAAVEADLIGRSPCRGIKLTADRRKDPRFLSIEELQALAAAIDPEYRAMVYLAGLVGLRFGECAGLRVGRIDFFRRTVTVAETANEVRGEVLFGEPKTKASRRTVSVPQFVADELSAHLARRAPVDPADLVFTSPEGAPLRRKHFRSRVWVPTVKRAGMEDLTFHGLRHSAVGFMIELGTHARVIQKRMGHSSIRTTMDVYGSVLEDVDTEVIDGLDGLVSGPGRGSRGLAAVSEGVPGGADSNVRPLTRGNSCGAEGSRTPGLLDATDAEADP